MKYKLSDRSLENLKGVHPLLVDVVSAAMDMQIMDFTVVEGVRTLERQKQLVTDAKSKTMRSKHLIQSDGYGHAVDLYPYPINMDIIRNPKNHGYQKYAQEVARFGILCGIMLSCAKRLKVDLINGMDWNGDGQTLDHTFFDSPHYQLVLR